MVAPIFFILSLISVVSAVFYSPPAKRAAWEVGEVQEIRYKTQFSSYTIGLWQQSASGGSATLGPIIFRLFSRHAINLGTQLIVRTFAETTNGPESRFSWLVQTYDFDLEASNVFFLWLFDGNSAQGNQSSPGASSSHFFNITAEADQDAPTTTSSASPTSVSTSSGTAQTTGNKNSEPTQTSDNNAGSSGGLSVGAQAGIGAGVGVVGLGVVVCVVLFMRYRSKKKKELEELRNGGHTQYPGGSGHAMQTWKPTPTPPADMYYYPQQQGPHLPRQDPAELPGEFRR